MKKRKKVLLVIPYFPPHIGGAENYAYHVAYGLVKKHGWCVVVVTSSHIANKRVVEKNNFMKIYRLPVQFRISNTPINSNWIFDLQKIITAEKPNLINAHAPVPFIADIAAQISGRIPFVLTYHSGPMLLKKSFFKDAIIKFYEKYLLPILADKATAIVSSSKYVKNALFKNKTYKVVDIAPGVDLKQFFPKKLKRKAFLFVGNLNEMERYKGLETLLKALKKVTQVHKEVLLTVVGDGSFRQVYERLVKKLNLEENVYFKGTQVGPKLQFFYQSAIALVHPSTFDSFPLVILEAMACETPIISTRVGGIPELVVEDKNGLLVEPENVSQLSKALLFAIENPSTMKKMGKAGGKLVKSKYDWNKKVKLTNNLFRNLLENS